MAGIARVSSRNLLNGRDSRSRRNGRLNGFKLSRIGRQASDRAQITKTIALAKNVRELIYKRTRECANEITISHSVIEDQAMAMTFDTSYGLQLALPDLSAHTIIQVWQARSKRANQQVKELAMEFEPKAVENSEQSNIAPQETLSSRRRVRIIRGETLNSIAERYFNDTDVSLLIAHINRGRIRDNFVDGKRVIRIKENQELDLPSIDELRVFYQRRAEALIAHDPIAPHCEIERRMETGTGIIAERAIANYIVTIVEQDVRSLNAVDPKLNLIVSPGPFTLT